MKNTLLILNYQREIPPFMQNLIHYADDQFERILYFTPELRNDNRDACRSEKLQVVQCKRSTWRKALFKSLWFCLSKPARTQVRLAKKNGCGIVNVYKQIVRHFVCGYTLFRTVTLCLRKGMIIPEETVITAAWFSSEAYAAAMLKAKYPALRTVSFAHSFEIDRDKNPFVMFDMNRMKHGGAESLIFISDRMRRIYREELQKLYPDLSDDTWQTRYLGSTKRFPDAVSPESDDGVFRLISCSSAVPVKRLHLLIDALTEWDGDARISWTHLGGGPLLEDLKAAAREKLAAKPNVDFTFTGALTNEEVQRYYVEHSADLFINVSKAEGLPVSLMECMSYGIPAIATDVGGTSEIVTPQTGFLLPKEFTAKELSDVIKEYIAFSSERKQSYRRDCLAYWQRCFDAEANTHALCDWLIGEE